MLDIVFQKTNRDSLQKLQAANLRNRGDQSIGTVICQV
jgi:hypothetical protein